MLCTNVPHSGTEESHNLHNLFDGSFAQAGNNQVTPGLPKASLLRRRCKEHLIHAGEHSVPFLPVTDGPDNAQYRQPCLVVRDVEPGPSEKFPCEQGADGGSGRLVIPADFVKFGVQMNRVVGNGTARQMMVQDDDLAVPGGVAPYQF